MEKDRFRVDEAAEKCLGFFFVTCSTVPFRIAANLLIMMGLFFSLIMAVPAASQITEPDTLRLDLDEMVIQATRDTETEASAPFSVAVKTRTIREQQSEPAFGLDRIAAGIPGLWVNDRQNYALGERVSMRGMGWRTAFGVRGIYVLLDDIPLTVPDGQTVMDILDPSMVRQIEVVRGPSSSFWGNAGGGTMFLSTRPASFDPSLNARMYAGAFGTYSSQIALTGRRQSRGYHLNTSYFRREGYRNHSKHQIFRMTGHMDWAMSSGSVLRITGAFVEAPDTRHPGSLTREELEENRRAAATLFENASAGKAWRQGQIGAALAWESRFGRWQQSAYAIARSLHNPLPFADIEVDRLTGGMRLSLVNDDRFIRWGWGVDAAVQSDDRRNYRYEPGYLRGDISLEQRETVRNAAWFARAKTSWEQINLSAGIRADAIRFASEDQRLYGGEDQSGQRWFTALSPSIGLSWNRTNQIFFLHYGASFETPTTTELVNRPDMTGGFNPDLEPERARGLEGGVRGSWIARGLRYDLAVFFMSVRDQLISFRTDEGEGRDFYRNGGETRHAGFEAALIWRSYHWVELMANYQWSHYTFLESIETDRVRFVKGNRIPGIPGQRFMSILTLDPGHLHISLTAERVGQYYADNANSEINPAFAVFHVRMAYNELGLGERVSFSPFLSMLNITDVHYNSSVSINATGGRFFEPAPGRAVYAGFSLNL